MWSLVTRNKLFPFDAVLITRGKGEMIADDRQGGNGDADGDSSPDVVAVLRHDRRREVVTLIVEAGGELSLVALASRVAAATDDTLPDVVIELHDVHLPELTGCGLVEYDDDMGAVTLADDPEEVEAVLETAANDEGPDA